MFCQGWHMLMRLIPLLLVGLAVPVLAAAPATAPAARPVKALQCDGPVGTNQNLPHLMAPLEKDGTLYGYAYITSCVVVSSESAISQIGDKIPYIQDAFVRDVNATPITKPGDDGNPVVDAPALQARLLADARRVMGKDNKIRQLVITDLQIALLHPTETVAPPPDDTPPAAPGAAAAAAPAATASGATAPAAPPAAK
jgi:hypothetical protein